MYYEDENNLYHYSYRKGDKVENVRDVDYTEVPNTAAKADPWEEKKPKKNQGQCLTRAEWTPTSPKW